MTPTEIATIIADYLRDRDDIASADVTETSSGLVFVAVMTQGGRPYRVMVAKVDEPS